MFKSVRIGGLLVLLFIFLILPSVSSQSFSAYKSGLNVSFQNDSVGFYLSSLTKDSGKNISFSNTSFWEIVLLNTTNISYNASYFPSNFSNFNFLSTSYGFKASWNDSVVQGLNVSVTGAIFSDYVDFNISIDNPDNGFSVYSTSFPKFNMDSIGSSASDDVLSGGSWSGTITPNFIGGNSHFSYRYPGFMSMQYFSFYDLDLDDQLYFQATDSEGFIKDFDYTPNVTLSRTLFTLINYPENSSTAGNDYYMNYTARLYPTSGNWYDASQKYRNWALNQSWLYNGKLNEMSSSQLSNTLKDSKLFLVQAPNHSVNLTFSDNIDEASDILDQYNLGVGDLISIWYDWHNNLFDRGVPEHLPPRNTLISALDSANSQGYFVIPYVNLAFWDSSLDSYNSSNISNYSRTLLNGSTYLNNAAFTIPAAELDPSLQYNRDLQIDIINSVISLGFKGLYWDYWSGTSPGLDFSINHGHPEGGGSYWEQGRIETSKQVRGNLTANSLNDIFTSEGFEETLIGDVDLMYSQYLTYYTNGILLMPLWETVYHDYILTSDLTTSLPAVGADFEAYLSLFANLYHSGRVPSLVNFAADTSRLYNSSNPNYVVQVNASNFISQLVDSSYAWKYQRFGQRIRPLNVSLESTYERGDVGFYDHFFMSSSVWNDSEGDIGILVTNVNSSSDTFNLAMDYSDYYLSGEYTLTEYDGSDYSILNESVTNDFHEEIILEPTSLTLIELVRCFDEDGDGYSIAPTASCSHSALDCNDKSFGINPGALEICDSIDNNCNGLIDESDFCSSSSGFGSSSSGSQSSSGSNSNQSSDFNSNSSSNSDSGVSSISKENLFSEFLDLNNSSKLGWVVLVIYISLVLVSWMLAKKFKKKMFYFS